MTLNSVHMMLSYFCQLAKNTAYFPIFYSLPYVEAALATSLCIRLKATWVYKSDLKSEWYEGRLKMFNRNFGYAVILQHARKNDSKAELLI